MVRWSEISELLDDDLLTLEEVDAMFQSLPKAKGRGSSSSSPAVDAKGFLEFARKVIFFFIIITPCVLCTAVSYIRSTLYKFSCVHPSARHATSSVEQLH